MAPKVTPMSGSGLRSWCFKMTIFSEILDGRAGIEISGDFTVLLD